MNDELNAIKQLIEELESKPESPGRDWQLQKLYTDWRRLENIPVTKRRVPGYHATSMQDALNQMDRIFSKP